MIDTHCHLSMVLNDNKEVDYNELNNIIRLMTESGVTEAITIGCNLEDSLIGAEIASKYDNIYCAVGVHSEEVESFDIDSLENIIVDNIKTGKLVAIGEIGLDYYWRKDNKEEQIRIFKQQIELAQKYDLPIVVHCRDAYGDVLDVLKQYAPFNAGGVIHCYSGSIEWAKEVIKLGFLISFTGIVTYPNANNIKEVAQWVDLDKFMVETDSPFLTPIPFRGKKNNPAYVVHTAKCISELKNINYEKIDKITTKNAKKLFKLK